MFKKIIIAVLLSLTLSVDCGLAIALPRIQLPEPSLLYDINGKEIEGLASRTSVNVDLEEISPYFLKAIISMEDKRFYKHHGVDPVGLFRALFINLRKGKVVEGGSTITQQTAKNLYLSNERTLVRKIKELYYALQLERQYTKDEILTLYCNSIYFSQGAYGVEAAARTFFGVRAADLSLAQAALLGGLPRWPSHYDPYLHPEEAKKRQTVVLKTMLSEKVISSSEYQKAQAEELVYQRAQIIDSRAPYFVAIVREYLQEKYGERMVYQGGLKVYSTLDLNMQEAANRAVQIGMQGRNKEMQVALVALDANSGQIRALVGGRDYNVSSYNRAYAFRQPGSTFKPFVYSLALQKGFTAAHMIKCEEIEFDIPGGKTYRPTDYGKEPYHWKDFTLKEAIMISDNVVAVILNSQLGSQNSAAHAEKFGFKSIDPVLSLPLGSNEVRPIDLAAGYNVFANQGVYSSPSYLVKVLNRQGQVLEETNLKQYRVVSPENSYIITDMLTGVFEPEGTGSHLKQLVGVRAAGKTGTTDNYVDAWFAGYTSQISCAVWVGYDQKRSVNLAGGVAAGPVWARFVGEASSRLPKSDFEKPPDIKTMNICLDSGLIASEYCPRKIEMAFEANTEPDELCYFHLPTADWGNGDSFWLNFFNDRRQ